MPVRKFLIELQKLGARYGRGQNSAATSAATTELISRIDTEFSGRQLTFTVPVTNVKWEDDVATIRVTYGGARSRRKLPLKITPHADFQVRMGQQEAQAIRPKTPLKFTGKIQFQRGRWGAVGKATGTQKLHTLRHNDLPGASLGTFTSQSYTIAIGRQEYPGVWNRGEEPDGSEADPGD